VQVSPKREDLTRSDQYKRSVHVIPAAAQVRALCACHQLTLIAAARSQMTASFLRGTFSQAELTADRVIKGVITR
jgi:hypothetical protein